MITKTNSIGSYKRLGGLIGLLIVASILITACQPAAASTQEALSPTSSEFVLTPSIEVVDQSTEDDVVTINESATVMVLDFSFSEEELTIPVGTTLVWIMQADKPHTVTADGGAFDSGTLTSLDTFEFTFTDSGTFPYYCKFHGGPGGQAMAATVVVID